MDHNRLGRNPFAKSTPLQASESRMKASVSSPLFSSDQTEVEDSPSSQRSNRILVDAPAQGVIMAIKLLGLIRSSF